MFTNAFRSHSSSDKLISMDVDVVVDVGVDVGVGVVVIGMVDGFEWMAYGMKFGTGYTTPR
jgi:hypothetical protein